MVLAYFAGLVKKVIIPRLLYNIFMDTVAEKPRKNLFFIALLIFIAEFLGIMGYYWIFDGRAGDASLTISRYVGLNPWSCAVFLVCNLAISILVVYHLITTCAKRGFIWRFLMYIFAMAFLALSVSPHLPDEGMSSTIHRFFAGVMFVDMALVGVVTMSRAERKFMMLYSMLFVIYAIFFCVCDVMRMQWFLDGIFWYESAYIFAFFGLTLPEPRG